MSDIFDVLTFQRTHGEWQSVFFVSAAIYAFGAVFFMIFGSGDIQDWAICDSELDLEEEKVELNSNGDIAPPIVKSPPRLIINGEVNTTDCEA